MAYTIRQSLRYADIGRIDAPSLCALPGVLDNISREGCRIHYTVPVVVDLESDYELKVTLAAKPSETFSLLCHPRWAREDSGNTEIGFSVLRSPDYAKFAERAALLAKTERGDAGEAPAGGSCQFV